MSKLDSKPMQRAQHSMSSHDLSHVYDFTSSTGMILPLVCDIVNPGEKIDALIDLSDTRTMPLDSAAYLDLDLHVDYFFVPMTLLMSKFESFVTRVNDYYSNDGSTYFNLPLLNLDTFKSAIVSSGYNRVTLDSTGLDFDEYGKGSLRLFDHLGYGTLLNSSVSGWSSDDAYNPSIFPWALLAYNAAYEYYYINDEYEKYDNTLFNMDVVVSSNISIDSYYATDLYQLGRLRYRNKYHDYFTRLKSSPIVSGKNLLDSAGSLSLAKSWLSRESSYALNGVKPPILIDGVRGVDGSFSVSGVPDGNNTVGVRTQFGFSSGPLTLTTNTGSGDMYNQPNGLDINTANLRALFANEKLWTITGMNRKQYDAQTLAHFGFDVPTDVMHQVQHIGHHIYNLKVGEVISTAGTATQPLATVAGKGYAFRNQENKEIHFTAPCHGVYIALYSSAIKRNYCGTFDKVNAIGSWQDFYQPEFDHLGMQPIFGFETSQNLLSSNGYRTNTNNPYGSILGWQYRYEQFKRKYNYATLAFANSYDGSRFVDFIAPFGTWSPADIPLKNAVDGMSSMLFNPSGVYLEDIKENPCELNNMMQVTYDPWYYDGTAAGRTSMNYADEPWLSYQTDPLIHHSLIHYTKLSTMSAYSMPRLDN